MYFDKSQIISQGGVCRGVCRQGRDREGESREGAHLLPLKSQCYLVVNPTLCCPPARITLLACVSRNGSRGEILPCIPKGKVMCSECRNKKKGSCLFLFTNHIWHSWDSLVVEQYLYYKVWLISTVQFLKELIKSNGNSGSKLHWKQQKLH